MTSAIVRVPGVPVDFAGETLIVPPLTLNALQQLRERINKFTGSIDEENLNTVVDAAHSALKRNYPDITRERVGELIDLGNMIEVFESVMDVGGLRRKAREKEPGEASAPLTGGASTQA